MRKYYKFKMNLVTANVLATVILILFCIPVYNYIIDLITDTKLFVLTFILYMVWMLLHEILHGIGHMLCGVKPKDLSYGADIKKGILFCLVRKEVSKKDILISLLFPFFFIGVVTYILGIVINNPVLIALSIFNISGACVDLLMFFDFIKLGNDITYIEPGEGDTFYIMSNKDIKKLFGLKLLEEGIYKEDMFSNISYKRFDISKFSIEFFILCVISTIAMLLVF